MKKNKILLFALLMIIGLSSVAIAYNVGDVIEVEVYGYEKGPNGNISRVGDPCIVGKTAAVSWHGGIPDLRMGTIIYLESTNKCYVINDIGTEPKSTYLGIEPFCNNINECYEITRNPSSGGNTRIKILHIPETNERKDEVHNVRTSLAALDSYIKNFKGIDADLCLTCKKEIKRDKWLVNVTNGTHYLVCKDNHVNWEEKHLDTDVDTICDICWNNVTTCYTCGNQLKIGWKTIENRHYKECVKGHPSYINEHKYEDEKCIVCSFKMEKNNLPSESNSTSLNTCSVCSALLANEWLSDGNGNHYRKCKNGHQEKINMCFDNNYDLKCDVCKSEITWCYEETCRAQLKPEWKYNSIGKHYKECVNGHHSYIANHTLVNNHCLVCDFVGDMSNNGSIFSDLPLDHWAYNEVKAMVDAGIVNGRSDGTLGTNDPITVEESIALLSRVAAQKGYQKEEGKVFLEDKITGWSQKEYILLMQVIGKKSGEITGNLGKIEMQLLLGNTEKEIIENYKKPVIREKMANLMGIFVEDGAINTNNILRAKDWSSVDSLYRARINELADRNIFRGAKEPDGIYVNPKEMVTRVEVIALVNRLYNLDKKAEIPEKEEIPQGKTVYYINEKETDIPILLYHEFYETAPKEEQYMVVSTPKKFEEDILYVLDKGYTFVSINDIIDYKNGEKALPEKSIALTFDDGYKSNYTDIFPILKKYKIPATIFVVDEFVGHGICFGWEEAKEMIDSGLITIGSHGHDHLKMSELDINEFKEKTAKAIKSLEENLGKQKYLLYAYPHGDNSAATNIALKTLGVDMCMTTISGTNTKSELVAGILKRNTCSYISLGYDL